MALQEHKIAEKQGYDVYSRNREWRGGYIGMNYYAARELHIPFKHDKDSVAYYSRQRKRDQQITTQHEIDEANLMKKGIKYKEAHRRVTFLERFADKSGKTKRITSKSR